MKPGVFSGKVAAAGEKGQLVCVWRVRPFVFTCDWFLPGVRKSAVANRIVMAAECVRGAAKRIVLAA